MNCYFNLSLVTHFKSLHNRRPEEMFSRTIAHTSLALAIFVSDSQDLVELFVKNFDIFHVFLGHFFVAWGDEKKRVSQLMIQSYVATLPQPQKCSVSLSGKLLLSCAPPMPFSASLFILLYLCVPSPVRSTRCRIISIGTVFRSVVRPVESNEWDLW